MQHEDQDNGAGESEMDRLWRDWQQRYREQHGDEPSDETLERIWQTIRDRTAAPPDAAAPTPEAPDAGCEECDE